jgi:hypothetical protein
MIVLGIVAAQTGNDNPTVTKPLENSAELA